MRMPSMRLSSGLGRRTAMAAAVVAAGLGFGAGEGRAANPLELNFWLSGPRYEARVPLCDDSWVTSAVASRFGEKESQYWNSALRIAAIEDIREEAFRPWHYASIPRRFCRGYALVSDGSRRAIYYSIGEDQGDAGFGWGIESCVVGLDRNWAFNPHCRMARP